ncbi:MAG TPA: proton-conducting transporter membrane subunit [Planctomycetota bacterium]|nr:proton-conducting transporter membrane subunit [Planctomycetota bacterium]
MTAETQVQLLLWVTAFAGLVCYVLNRRLRLLSAVVALAATVVAFVVSIGVFRSDAVQFQLLTKYAFKFSDSARFAFDMRFTSLSGMIVLGIGFFGLLIVVYSLRYARAQTEPGKYYAFTLWTLAGAHTAALANNLLLLVLAWEVVTLMLYLLVGLGRNGAREGSAKTFGLLGFSECAMLLGVVLVAFTSGSGLRISEISINLAREGAALNYVAYILIMLGAITKAGAMPLHTWIPSASRGAPLSVMAFLPAALDKLLGIYLLALVSLQMFTLDAGTNLVLMIIGAVTIVFAVMMAMVQHDVRKLLSYHAISQVGYMVLGIGTGNVVGIAGGLFHMVNHAIYKSCLFMGAGAVADRTGETEVDRLGGLAGAMPVTFLSMFVAAMAISGIPPFNGFVSKWMVYQGTVALGGKGVVFLVAAVFGSVLTLASFIKVLHSMFFGTKPEKMREEKVPTLGRLSLGVPMAALAVLCIVFGVWAQLPLGNLIGPALAELPGVDMASADGGVISAGTGALEFTRGLWAPGAATLLILLGAVLGVVVFLIGRGSKVRVSPPYLAGETYTGDKARYAGTSFYKTVEELPVFGTIYKDAEDGVYDAYYLGGKLGNSLVQLLRKWHSGQLPVYISWCIIGLTIIVGYLIKLNL